MDCLVVCAPGLERVLGDELAALRIRRRRIVHGGIEATATARQLYAINVWSRTASRVLVRAARFRATSFSELERRLASVDWSPWLSGQQRLVVRVSSGASKLHHTGAVAERVARVLPGTDDHDAPEQPVVVRIRHDTVLVSVDSSGEHLHRRGWRLATAKAPLRETLAAAMVLATGWGADVPLVDPLCGSGTIAIEAALLATGRAPGAARDFAFRTWPSFEPGTWASVRADVQRAEASAQAAKQLVIVAADRDAGAVAAARDNAARAGVTDLVEVRRAPITETLASLPSPPGWLVTNPPYGTRVGGGDLRNLYATIGKAATGAEPWRVGMLADEVLAGHAGLERRERFRTKNGGIPVAFTVTE